MNKQKQNIQIKSKFLFLFKMVESKIKIRESESSILRIMRERKWKGRENWCWIILCSTFIYVFYVLIYSSENRLLETLALVPSAPFSHWFLIILYINSVYSVSNILCSSFAFSFCSECFDIILAHPLIKVCK